MKAPEYKSPISTSKRQSVFIDKDDQRLQGLQAGLTKAREGAEVYSIDPTGSAGSVASSFITSYTATVPQLNYGQIVSTVGDVANTATPTLITNLTAAWVNDDVKLTFTWDSTLETNKWIDYFDVQVHDPSSNTYFPLTGYKLADFDSSSSGSNQVLILKDAALQYTNLSNVTQIDKVKIAPLDVLRKTPGYTEANLSGYSNGIPAPTISVSHSINAYTVTMTNFSTASVLSNFYGTIIQEYISNETNASNIPTDAVWQQVAPVQITNTANIYAGDQKHRWVRAVYYSKNGGMSAYSTPADVTPDPFIATNTTAPTNVTAASAAFSSSGTGNDVIVNFTLPTDGNAGTVIKVKLVPTSNTSLSGFFNYILKPGDTSFTITSQQIYGQFSSYFSSYAADVSSISNAGVESASALHISTFTRTSSLTSFTPTQTLSAIIDGYTSTFNLVANNATYGEIYEFYVDPASWLSSADFPDFYDGAYSSGGASGGNTLIINNVTGDMGESIDISNYLGYIVTGNGINSFTYVSGISKSGSSYTITLSNNLSAQASGNYHFQSLIYSGGSPANIFASSYLKRWVIIAFYDQYDNRSLPSSIGNVTPINPTSITNISNAINVGGASGAIYVGTSPSNIGSRVVVVGSDATINGTGYAGIFAYDNSNNATTQIISNSSLSNSYSFVTTRAHIGDWSITESHIQNDMNTSGSYTTGYTGLSGSNTNYSIWAGATASDNSNNDAKFYVTPGGKVHAENIYITGNGTSEDLINVSSGVFKVDNLGAVTASNATITGSLNVSQSSNFNSNINIGISGILTAGASQSSGSSVQLNYQGLVAYDSSHNATTHIYSTPLTGGYTFQTSKAVLGSSIANGWLIGDNKISSNYITLDSPNQQITITSNNNPDYGMILKVGSNTSNAITIGSFSTTPGFAVTHSGILNAKGAKITGSLEIAGDNSFIKYGKTDQNDITNNGFYFANDGTFIMGGNSTTSSYLQWNNTDLKLVSSYVRTADGNSGYAGPSYISVGANGTKIFGLPTQGEYLSNGTGLMTWGTPHYAGIQTFGDVPRQRMLVEDPTNGQVKIGFAIYYQDSNISKTIPDYNSGMVGDMWLVY